MPVASPARTMLPWSTTYAKVNPADPPIITFALTSDTLPIFRLSDAADTLLAQRLSQVTGVGRVLVQGTMRPAVRVQADPVRLAAYGLSLEDVRTAIAAAMEGLAPGDVLAIAGKGHEQGQTVGGTVLPFDDVATVRGLL